MTNKNDPIHVEIVSPAGSLVNTTNPLNVDTRQSYNTNDIEEASATITYIGMEDKDGLWYIKKIDTTSANAFGHATIKNNKTYKTYTTAWTSRAALTYGDYSEAF